MKTNKPDLAEDIMTELMRRPLVATALLSPLAYAKTYAQAAWPSGTIRIVVPFPAGGSVDTISRLIQTGTSRAISRASYRRSLLLQGGQGPTVPTRRQPPAWARRISRRGTELRRLGRLYTGLTAAALEMADGIV